MKTVKYLVICTVVLLGFGIVSDIYKQLVPNSESAVITIPKTFTSGSTLTAADLNNLQNTIYNDYNGNITNANISSSAAIAASKLDLTSPVFSGTATGTYSLGGTPTISGTLQGNVTSNGSWVSTVATGTAPLVVTSATPVANLIIQRHPLVYDTSGNILTNRKIVIGAVSTFVSNPNSVTFTGSSVFGTLNGYYCTTSMNNSGTADNNAWIKKISVSQIDIYSELAADEVVFICIGQ